MGKTERGLTYIGVELTYEAGEVVVLEVGREEKPREFRRVPNHEAVAVLGPLYDFIGARVVHHVIRLDKERSRTTAAPAGLHRSKPIHFR